MENRACGSGDPDNEWRFGMQKGAEDMAFCERDRTVGQYRRCDRSSAAVGSERSEVLRGRQLPSNMRSSETRRTAETPRGEDPGVQTGARAQIRLENPTERSCRTEPAPPLHAGARTCSLPVGWPEPLVQSRTHCPRFRSRCPERGRLQTS